MSAKRRWAVMVVFAGLLALGASLQPGMAGAQPTAAGARLAVPARQSQRRTRQQGRILDTGAG